MARRRGTYGAISVECALTFTIFALTLFVGMQLTHAMYMNAALQNAVHRAGRYGALNCPGISVGAQCNISAIKSKADEIMGRPIPQFNAVCGGVACSLQSPPSPNEWLQLRATYPFRIAAGDYAINLVASSNVRVESIASGGAGSAATDDYDENVGPTPVPTAVPPPPPGGGKRSIPTY